MGLFSGISKALFGDPSGDIQQASDEQLAFQQMGADDIEMLRAMPLEMRNQALSQLQGFYGGGEGQNQFIQDVKSSPFYGQMVQAGQEGVLDRAGAMGLSRSGNTAQDLSRSNQGVLQGLVNQRLGGLEGFARTPIQSIADQYNQMGQNVGQAGVAMANANQGLIGNTLGLVSGGLGLAGSLGWNPFGGGGTPTNTLPGPSGSNISDYTGSAYQNWLGG